MPRPTVPLPQVRSVAATQPLVWLARGWSDLRQVGWLSLAHGVALALFGALIAAVARDRFWLMAGALSGFLVVAPILATSFYVLSRALERGEPANLAAVRRTWLFWQSSHRTTKWGNDYWCLVQFGALLALAGTGWVLTSAAAITLLSPRAVVTPMDFIREVMLVRDHWLFEAWLLLGGLLAAPVFASSVVAIPLLLDHPKATIRQSVLVSWRCVLTNPVAMALWATLIMLFTLLGLGSLMLGLILVTPMLAHASWHAYRDLVEPAAPATKAVGGRQP